MAGNPQGGGAPRPNMGNAGPAMQNWQNAQQNMQQNMAGMPSQYPGANVAAPGGGMASAAVMPQQQNQNPQVYSAQPAYAGPAVMPQAQGSNMASTAVMPQAPQMTQETMYSSAVGYPGMQQPQHFQSFNPGGKSIGMMPGETGRGGPMQSFNPGGGSAAPQMSQVMPQAPISVGNSQPMPQMDQGQMQQIQAMANNPAYQQALLAAQQATTGGGSAAPTPMPRPMPQDPRMQQNPRMTPRVSDMMPRREQMARPQIQGNPNSIPMQRGQGRVR